MKNKFLSNWNFMRVLRLALAGLIIGQGVYAKDWLFVVFGAMLALTALVFKAGCCSGEACYTPIAKNNNKVENISYEEVN